MNREHWIYIIVGALGWMVSMLQGQMLLILYLPQAIENVGVLQVKQYFLYLNMGTFGALILVVLGLGKVLRAKDGEVLENARD